MSRLCGREDRPPSCLFMVPHCKPAGRVTCECLLISNIQSSTRSIGMLCEPMCWHHAGVPRQWGQSQPCSCGGADKMGSSGYREYGMLWRHMVKRARRASWKKRRTRWGTSEVAKERAFQTDIACAKARRQESVERCEGFRIGILGHMQRRGSGECQGTLRDVLGRRWLNAGHTGCQDRLPPMQDGERGWSAGYILFGVGSAGRSCSQTCLLEGLGKPVQTAEEACEHFPQQPTFLQSK